MKELLLLEDVRLKAEKENLGNTTIGKLVKGDDNKLYLIVEDGEALEQLEAWKLQMKQVKNLIEQRWKKVNNPETTAEELDIIAMVNDGEDKLLSVGIAEHHNASEFVYKMLSKDRDPMVREEVAQNTKIPEILDALADDESFMVVIAVIGNQYTAEHTKMKLAKIHCLCIQEAMVLDTAMSDKVWRELLKNVIEVSCVWKLIDNPKATKENIWVMARDSREEIRMVVAEYEKTPAEILDELSKDNSYLVKMKVVNNSVTKLETLKKMAEDPDSKIANAAKREIAERNARVESISN